MVPDQQFVLEDDEDRNFSREIDLVGDHVRTAVHRYNKQLQVDQLLTKSIDKLMNMPSVSSVSSPKEFDVTMQNIEKPAAETAQENIAKCLELMYKREMTPQ